MIFKYTNEKFNRKLLLLITPYPSPPQHTASHHFVAIRPFLSGASNTNRGANCARDATAKEEFRHQVGAGGTNSDGNPACWPALTARVGTKGDVLTQTCWPSSAAASWQPFVFKTVIVRIQTHRILFPSGRSVSISLMAANRLFAALLQGTHRYHHGRASFPRVPKISRGDRTGGL
jgi:hypothetical protein